MDISVAIPLTYLTATGNPYTGTPGDTNWLKILNYFNLDQAVWANEPGGDWESLYSPGISAGTITATDTFSLPSGILKPTNKAQDYIYVNELQTGTAWTSGQSWRAGQQALYLGILYQAVNNLTNDTVIPPSDPTNWQVIPPQVSKFTTVPGPQLKYYNQLKGYVAIVDGQLKFSRAFTSTDLEYGGTLYVPAYKSITPFVTNPVATSGAISVDDPTWLIYYAAQEWAQTDVTLVQNVPSLVAKATDRMNAMMLNNQRIKTVSQQTPMTGAAYGDTFGFEAGGGLSDTGA